MIYCKNCFNMQSRGRNMEELSYNRIQQRRPTNEGDVEMRRTTSRQTILQDEEKKINKTTDSESHKTKDDPICKEISKENYTNNFDFEKDTETENFNHTQANNAKDNFETIFPFHTQISAPASVEIYEKIAAPMSAPLPINPVSPISLDIFGEAVERASNNTSPIRGSPISGINMLLSDEEPFVDSSSSWIPESDEEIRKKRMWISTVDNSSSESQVKISRQKKHIQKTRCKKIRKFYNNSHKSSSSETENESSTIKRTKTRIIKAKSNFENDREVRLDGTGNTIHCTIAETTDCESIAEDTKELRETNNTQKKKIVRWKRSNKSQWKRVKEQKKKRQCLPYENSKGKTIAPKLPKTPKCSVICRNKCTQLFSETVRLELCKEYWAIDNFRLQKEYLLKRIIVKPVARPIKNLPPEKQRSSSREFGFYKDNNLVKVCKSFFTTTLCISNGPIETAIHNTNENGSFQGSDSRGKIKPPNKTPEDKVKEVKQHIDSFPIKDSHYCRRDTTRKYLNENLSISKMYELYETKMKNENKTPVKLNVYKKIFGTEYNLAFFHPKKDQCCLCNRYHRTPNPDDALKKEYEDHIKRKEASFVSKDIDKQRSESDENFLCITMDLQSLLQVPSTSDSLMYYCRKLNLYNLSVYEFKPPQNNAHCIIWTELNGKRGSIEIASAINSWMKTIPDEVTEVTIYSDTCSGQNRNQYMAAFLLYLVQVSPNLLVIEQKYLESGHTFMEVDSMHSAIEKEKRFCDVYSVIDWKGIMHRARSTRHNKNARPYQVTELFYNDMIDVKALASKILVNKTICSDGSKANWLKIKCLRFEKAQPGVVQLRYDYEGPYLSMDTSSKTRKARQTRNTATAGLDVSEISLEKAYQQPLSISDAKKKDLINLCKKNIIPIELHPWYESIPSTSQPTNSDSD